MVVAIYHPPQDCPCGDMPVFFESSAEAAAAKAREMAGPEVIGTVVSLSCATVSPRDIRRERRQPPALSVLRALRPRAASSSRSSRA